MAEQLLTSVAALLDNPSGTPDATLTAAIATTNGTSFTWSATPSGLDTTKSFVVRIDQELLYCDSVSGTTVTVNASGRGAEGSTAATHLNGANVYVVWSAAGLGRWFASQQITSLQGNADKVLYISHAGAVTELALGTNRQVLQSNGATSAPSFANRSLASAQVKYTGGDFNFTATSFTELSSSLRISVAATTGDVLLLTTAFYTETAAQNLFIDIATVVSGSLTNFVGGGANGIIAWVVFAGNTAGTSGNGGAALYTVQSGDISGGNVTVTLAGYNAAAATRLFRATATNPLFFSVVNLGQ